MVVTPTGHLIALVQDLVVEECNFEHDSVTIQDQLEEERTAEGWEDVYLADCATFKAVQVQ